MLPFQKILILIHNNIDAEIAIHKLKDLYEHPCTELHFVCVIKYFSWRKFIGLKPQQQRALKNSRIRQKKIEAEMLLNEIQTKVFQAFPDAIIYTQIVVDASVNHALVQYINLASIDLVLSIRQTLKNIFYQTGININYIIQHAGCPVLSVNAGTMNHSIKSILIPVYSFLPDKKIELASAFAKKYNAQIYIITILNDNEAQSKIIADVFYLTYKKLKDEGFNPHYKMLSGVNSPEILIKYAHQVNADMILINPEKGTPGKKSIIKRSLADFLSPLSPLQVLMLQPAI
ncbi:MAG: hypothetical protein EKK39_01980 [Sphingobacteriales bacterium]|uniref:universal stress protein n=1 Tax=Hydrotalea flava TaxID=714549 RepID=UPI00083543E9|nr:universal stress protein [Hydrotalea flava]RTL55945.1 MAG: hypothetical protein EKK39_01980 [Sphingobacteriales bacterium]